MRGKWISYIIVVLILCFIASLLVVESLIKPGSPVSQTVLPSGTRANASSGKGPVLVDQDLIMSRMFPDKVLQVKDKLYEAGDREHYYIESLKPGSYTGSGKDEVLVVARRPINEPSHNEGFYQAFMAVFDNKTGQRVSRVQNFSADEGDYGLFEINGRSLIFFAGNKTYQGWTEWDAGLWEVEREWQKLWPLENEFWKDKAVEVKDTGFDLYIRKVLVPASEERIMPEYTWELSKRYYWNSQAGEFVEQ